MTVNESPAKSRVYVYLADDMHSRPSSRPAILVVKTANGTETDYFCFFVSFPTQVLTVLSACLMRHDDDDGATRRSLRIKPVKTTRFVLIAPANNARERDT